MKSVRWIGDSAACLVETQFTPDDIGSEHQRYAFKMGDTSRQTFAPEAAIGRDDEPFRRYDFERATDGAGDQLRGFDGGMRVIDNADPDLFVGFVIFQQTDIARLVTAAFQHEDVAIHFEEVRQ